METPEAPERPRAVTVIGWLWLVLAGAVFLRAVMDLVLWKILQPAMPSLLHLVTEREPEMRLLGPLFQLYSLFKTVEAVLAAAVGISAYFFLRLRPWARIALQTVSWLVLFYGACFAGLWIAIWRRPVADEAARGVLSLQSRGALGLLAGLLAALVLVAGMIVLIRFLRSPRIRAAFAAPPAGAPRS
jgi:hypothetical protein